jgi:uncharacterized membrane protein
MMATLFAITYPDDHRAKEAMEKINWLDFDWMIDVKGACWVAKDNGELKVHPRSRHIGKGAAGGSLGLLVGALFSLPVVGLAAGAAAGIRMARQRDADIDEAFVSMIGEKLESGGSAVFVLADEGGHTDRAAREVAKLGGTLHSADIPPDRLAHFQAMLDQLGPDAQPAAGDNAKG